MIPDEADNPNETDETDRQADAMKSQLSKDVASWSAARSGETSGPIVRTGAPSGKPPTPRAPRQKAKPVEAEPPAPAVKQPFRMSYDGTTDRDYIAQRIKLGAR